MFVWSCVPDKCQDYTCKFLLKGKVASYSKRNKTVFCVFGENAVQMLLGILWRLCDFMAPRLVVLSCSLCPPRAFMSFVDSLQSLHPAIHADEADELIRPNAFIYSVFIFFPSLCFLSLCFHWLIWETILPVYGSLSHEFPPLYRLWLPGALDLDLVDYFSVQSFPQCVTPGKSYKINN